MKELTVKEKDRIESIVISILCSNGKSLPDNYEQIVQYVFEDVCEEDYWSILDVALSIRRYKKEEQFLNKH